MKKLSALLFLALLLCALLVSCGGEATVIEIDATNADLFNEDFDVTARSYIKIVNMDPTNLIAVRSSSDSRDVSRDSVKSNGVIKSGDCNYIPIPDKSNSSHFSGRDVDIRGNGQVVFVKLHSGEGPMILSEAEDPISYYDSNGNRVYEKFFHVDFSQPPYDEIDRSRIAILVYDQGSGGRSFNWGYVTNGSGGMKPTSGRGGLYDFSEFNYINLYMTNAIYYSNGDMTDELILMNPIVCTEGTEVDLVEKVGVYSFVPSNSNKQYVMEFNSDHISENFNLRMIDGIFVGFPMKVYEGFNRSVYYIGTLDSELLVNLYDSGSGKVTFREATPAEVEEYQNHFISVDSQHAVISHRFEVGADDEYMLFVDSDVGISNSIVTLEFKYDDGSYVSDSCRGYFKSSHTYGEGTSGRGVKGAYTKTTIRNCDILAEVELNVDWDRTRAITATVTIDRSDVELTEKIMPDAYELYIAPNNNQDVYLVKRPYDGSYTVPNLKWTGHTFRGLMYSGTLYQPGESFEIGGPCTCAVGVWD